VIAVDTSALVAILLGEPEAAGFAQAITEAERCFMSAANVLEASMVMIGRRSPEIARAIDDFIARRGIEIVPLDEAQSLAGREAFVRFGKGRHPAGLNFGDCMSYALAKTRGLPLLYKGADFTKTDIAAAAAAMP
jgi:ribonuclease VapC